MSTLQYEPLAPAPNTVLAIYKNPSSAQRLISASPLRFILELKDAGWKYSSSGTPESTQQPTRVDPPIQEQDSKKEALARPDQSHPRDGPSQPPRAVSAIDSAFQGSEGSQKWGTRGPSIKHEASSPAVSEPGTPISSLRAAPASSKSLTHDFTLPRESHYARTSNAQVREFELKITPSNTNHQAYIERQGYYGPFTPKKKTLMAEDLEGRVPLDGLADCDISKLETPLRTRIRWMEKGTLTPFSLKALYEEKQRSETTA